MKLSNKFTTARLLFSPVFFLLYYIPIWTGNGTAAFVSACAMIPLLAFFQLTDYWDGHYARKNGEVSDFGKLYDPFADVMLNLTAFVCAMSSFSRENGGYMPAVIFVFIMYREFSQSFLRMLAVKQGVAIAARKSGKTKTVFYIGSSFIMLACESLIRLGLSPAAAGLFGVSEELFLHHFKIVIQVLYAVCLCLSYASFFDYIRNFKTVFKDL